MKPWLLYLLLLKATLTTFSGLASLPVIREDLVLRYRVLSDEQLNTAVIVSRTTPGPVGVYVVSVGYSVAGIPGAIAGWAAMCTPAFLIIPFIRVAWRHAPGGRMRGSARAVVAASAGLLADAVIPLARETLTEPWTLAIAVACVAMILRRVNPLWLVLGACASGLVIAISQR